MLTSDVLNPQGGRLRRRLRTHSLPGDGTVVFDTKLSDLRGPKVGAANTSAEPAAHQHTLSSQPQSQQPEQPLAETQSVPKHQHRRSCSAFVKD